MCMIKKMCKKNFIKNKRNKFTYIDIFAGCGGLSLGLQNAGWTGVFAIEKNDMAFETLKYNLVDNKKGFKWPIWMEKKAYDINVVLKEKEEYLKKLKSKVLMVAGGPPCQGFSMAGKRDMNDKRNKLVHSYIKFISVVMPEVIVFENVHGFTSNFSNGENSKNFSLYVVNSLKRYGYNVASQVINMADYGVPQNRKRFILVAMRNYDAQNVFEVLKKNNFKFCKSKGINTKVTVKEAISDLQRSHGEEISLDTESYMAGVYGPVLSKYQKLMRGKEFKCKIQADSHRFVNHTTNIINLHKELLTKAPKGKRITPYTCNIKLLKRRGVTVLDANCQSPTITSIPDELVHYCEPRILTVREHARLQSFPDWFKFRGKYTSGGQHRKQEVPRYTQIGNAVPPLFAEQIGSAIIEVMNNGE